MLPNRPNPFPMENDNSQYNYSKDYSSSFENNNNKELDSKYKNLNCSKEYLRSTINIFPKYESQLNQLKIPIGVIISPSSIYTKKGEFPLISYGEDNEVPRCKNENCKAFVNPFIKIIDNDKWQCNICKAVRKRGKNRIK